MSEHQTNVEIGWQGGVAPAFLRVLMRRPITSDELHLLADVVMSIEEFRATALGEALTDETVERR